MVRSPRRIGAALVIATALCGGCKADDAEPSVQKDETPSPSTEPVAAVPTAVVELPPAPPPRAPDPELTGLSVLETSGVASLIPRDTVLVMTAASIERAFEIVGRDALARALGETFESVRKDMKKSIGHDLSSLDGLRAFGIDTASPVSMFVVSEQEESGGMVVGITDRDTVAASLKTLARRARTRMESRTVGEATINCPNWGPCAVVTETHLYLVYSDRGSSQGLAESVANLGKTTTLAANKRFAAALADLENGKDMAMFVNLGSLTDMVVADLERGAEHSNPFGGQTEWVTEALEDAKKNDPDRVAELEKELAWFAELEAEQAKRLEAERAITRDLLAPLRSVVVAADFSQRALAVHAQFGVEGDTILKKLFRNDPGVLPLSEAVGEDAHALLAVHTDPKVALELIEHLSAVAHVDLETTEQFGIDVRTDLLAASSGTWGVAVTGDLEGGFAKIFEDEDTPFDLEASLKWTATMGIDPPHAPAFGSSLQKLAESIGLKGSVEAGWVHAGVHLGLVGPTFTASTDEAVRARVAAGESSSSFASPSSAGYAEALRSENVAAVVAGRPLALLAATWLHERTDARGVLAKVEDADPDVLDEVDSEELRAARAKLLEIQLENGEAWSKELNAELKFAAEAHRGLGSTALAFAVSEAGFELRGSQWLVAESWPALALDLVERGVAVEAAQRGDIWEAESRRRAAQEEVNRIEQELRYQLERDRIAEELAASAAAAVADGTAERRPSEDISVDCLLDPTKCRTSSTGSRKQKIVLGGDGPEKMSTSDIKAGIAGVKEAAAACGATHSATPGIKVPIKISVSGITGKVTSAAAQSEHAGTALGQCVEAAATTATFITFDKPSQGFTYKFRM